MVICSIKVFANPIVSTALEVGMTINFNILLTISLLLGIVPILMEIYDFNGLGSTICVPHFIEICAQECCLNTNCLVQRRTYIFGEDH